MQNLRDNICLQIPQIGFLLNLVTKVDTIFKHFFKHILVNLLHFVMYILWKTMAEMDRMVRLNLVMALVCNVSPFLVPFRELITAVPKIET